MKKNLKTLLALMAGTMALAACSDDAIVEEVIPQQPEQEVSQLVHMTFTALQENNGETRAMIDGPDIKWSEGDAIAVYDGRGIRKFTLQSGAGTTLAEFDGLAYEADSYVAVYPYSDDITVDSKGQVAGLSIPRIQTPCKDGTDPSLLIMTSVSEDGSKAFAFKNAVSFVKLTPMFDCDKIVFETDLASGICGDVILTPSAEAVTTTAQKETACGHIILDGSIEAGSTYYIATVPCTLSNGFAVTFDSENRLWIKETSKKPELQRSHVLNLGTFDKGATTWSQSNILLRECPGESGYSGYRIYDWRDFERFTDLIASRSSESSEATLMCDIDYDGNILHPVVAKNAGGILFNGCGHKIYNYVQGYRDTDDFRYAGLVYVEHISIVTFKDLTLAPKTFNVQNDKDIYGGGFLAQVGEYIDGDWGIYSYFQNCRFVGDLRVETTGNYFACAGGFVGVAPSKISIDDSIVEGSVSAISAEDLAYAGGFIGYLNPDCDVQYFRTIEERLSRCRNKAAVFAVGNDDSGTGPLTPSCDGICAGGFVGRVTDNTLTDSQVILNSCVNEGKVVASATDNDYAYAGGMIGCLNSDGVQRLNGELHPMIYNCLNKGLIQTISTDTGCRSAGMVGICYDDKTEFCNCVNLGPVMTIAGVMAHISGLHGSYNVNNDGTLKCRWNDNDLYGIYDKEDRDGYTEAINASLMNVPKWSGEFENFATWTGENGTLDLDF